MSKASAESDTIDLDMDVGSFANSGGEHFRGVYRLFLDLFFCGVVDFGAMLWLLSYVESSWAFSYALVALVSLALVFFTLAYFFFVRAPTDVVRCTRAVVMLFKTLSIVCFCAFLCALICASLEVAHVLPNSVSAMFAYSSHQFTQTVFGDDSCDSLCALDEAIKLDESNPVFLAERARLLIRKARKAHSNAESAASSQAVDASSVEDWLHTAVSDYTSLMLLEPTVAEWPSGRSNAYALRGGDFLNKALEDARTAVELDEKNGIYCIEYAKRLVDCSGSDSERLRIAKEYLDRAAELSPGETDAEYYDYYIRALMGMQDTEVRESGLSSFVKVITRDYGGEEEVEVEEAVTQLGSYLKENDTLAQKAVETFERELQKRGNDEDLRFAYGCTLLLSSRAQEALDCFSELIRDNPLYFDAYNRRAWASNRLGFYDEALSDLDIVIQHDDSTKYHVYRADILYNKEEYENAISEYIYAADNGSNMSAYCYHSVGQSYYCLGAYDKATSYCKRALSEGMPDGSKCSCYRGWADAEYMLGKNALSPGSAEESESHFRTALELYLDALKWAQDDAERATCIYWAGNDYMYLGEYQNAIDAFERAYGLSANEEYLKNVEWCRGKLGA